MSPITHFAISWLVSQAWSTTRRDRAIITLAGIVPDIDGLGLVGEILTRDTAEPLLWWTRYHHVLAHNLLLGLGVAALGALLGSRSWIVAVLSLLSFHLHLLGDLIGARGPDGYQWPIIYLWPFNPSLELTWQGQWGLNSWPNLVITAATLGMIFLLARVRGYSPLELVSIRMDRAFVKVLRRRFPISQ